MWNFGLEIGQTVTAASAPPDPEVVAFARDRLGFEPDFIQEGLLASGVSRGLVNCSRQWGKSTVAAVMAVYRAYFRSKSLVVMARPTEKQSAELVWKARDFMIKLGLRQRRDGSNRISLRFPNGSRFVGIRGKEATLRGFSAVSLLIIDEASRVDDAVYKALRPNAGRGEWGFVAAEYSLWEAGIFL